MSEIASPPEIPSQVLTPEEASYVKRLYDREKEAVRMMTERKHSGYSAELDSEMLCGIAFLIKKAKLADALVQSIKRRGVFGPGWPSFSLNTTKLQQFEKWK